MLESELAQALERGEFELFFQPQVAADDAAPCSVAEALLRWRHPQRGLLGPGAFIDVAERHRLMLKLGEWVLRAAALQARDWRARGVAAVPLAVKPLAHAVSAWMASAPPWRGCLPRWASPASAWNWS